MPARWIQVRRMKEQEAEGDLPAIAAAMQIIGASYVETLDTKGTDGSNVHLGGPETITGYFGGIGQCRQLMAPAPGQFRKAVQQQQRRPRRRVPRRSFPASGSGPR